MPPRNGERFHSLWNRAGGVFFHYIAFRNRRRWRPFVHQVAKWLKTWRPRSSDLLLIGASGGYSLNEEFLKQFRRIIYVEIDPLAAWIFKKRFSQALQSVELVVCLEDFFSPLSGQFDYERTRVLWDRYPEASILFANFLGQLSCLYPQETTSPSWDDWKERLSQEFRGRDFRSFHDRLTVSEPPLEGLRSPEGVLTVDLVQSLLGHSSKKLEILDHGTEGLFDSSRERCFFSWERLRGRYHVIEGV